MNKFIKLFNIISILILLNGCGYSILNKPVNNFQIIDISLEGEGKINYNIKNKLLFNNTENNKRKLNLKINTDKKKIVKNKSIKNEITSYQIQISSTVTYKLLGSTEENRFSVSQSGDFKVSSNRLTSLNNEKRLVETMTNSIIEKISEKLINSFNDN